MKDRKVVGFFRQTLILLWKNGILFKRNVSGTLVEILVSLLFVFILIFLRFFVDSTKYNEQSFVSNPIRNVLDAVNVTTKRSLILYYPNNSFVQEIVTNAYYFIKKQKPNFNATVSASISGEASNLDSNTISNLFALVSFPDSYTGTNVLPNKIQYKIFTQERTNFQYNVISNFYSKNDYLYTNSPESYCFSNKYFLMYNTIFNPIKHAVDFSLISNITGIYLNNNTKQVKFVQYDCPEYDNDIFKTRFSFFPLIIVQIAFLFTLIVNLGNIIVEKQTKMKEYLKLVGIKWYVMWITWIIRSLIPYMILSLLFAIVTAIKFNPRIKDDSSLTKKAVFYHTNFFVGFSLFFVYSIQVAMFTLLLGQIFSKTFIAKTITIILWLLTVINFYDNLPSSGIKYIFCMFPNAALIFAFQAIFQFERSSKPLSYLNMYTNLYDDPLNLGAIMAAMIVWTLIYIPITWYIERIFPGEYGAPLPFYFPFMPSYWRNPNKTLTEDKLEFDSIKNDKYGFEKEPTGLSRSISIQNITKKFRSGLSKNKTVVDNLSLNFYQNQITGLLGHNGAGKTTTTFMLCGIYAPTSGDAFILGKSIKTNMDDIRSSLGFCPQYDILYEDLTVAEHLDLIASIKGYSKSEIKEEILNISKFVGLDNDLEKKSKQLSGGMKRRLSVAMALTGGSKIIILDEPTSGLDPYNRRTLWELIRKFKKGRCIVLTTHFMEEADALSDRIAIMNHGQVKCCGSPLFLKNAFGSGFRLAIAKNLSFDENKFKEVLKEQIEKYLIETNIAAEMSISVPYGLSSKLPQLITTIEEKKNIIGIDGYGISSPTIEEVFIKVGSIDRNYEIKEEIKDIDDSHLIAHSEDLNNAFSGDFHRNKGFKLWIQQVRSLWLKRFRIFYRRYILAAIILILPFLLEAVLSALIPSQTNLINSIRGVVSSSTSYELTLKNYSTHTIPYYVKGEIDTTPVNNLINNYFTQIRLPGVSLLKLDNDSINEYVLSYRKSNVKNLLNNYYAGFVLNLTNNTDLSATFYYNSLAFHSSANILNEIDNLIFNFLTNDYSKSISTINVPIQSNNTLSGTSNFLEVLACIDSLPVSLLNFINSIIVAFMIGIMVIHIAREKVNGSKQLQLLSGTHYMTYWFSNYLFDFLIHLINISLIVIFLKIVDVAKNDTSSETNAIAGNETLGYFYLLLFLSSFSWCTIAFIWSFFFKSEIIGFVVLVIVLGFASFLDIIWTFIELLIQNGSNVKQPGSKLMNVIRIIFALVFPNVTIKRGLYNLKIRTNSYCIDSVNSVLGDNFTYNEPWYSFNEPGIGMELLFCGIQFLVGNLILIILEMKLFSKLNFSCCKKLSSIFVESNSKFKLESDVQKESDRIKNSDLKELSSKEPLVVSELFKKFMKNKTEFIAVNKLSFGVSQKECFGLLGLNGAGKTTTFKMLTGELEPSSGKAFINGNDVVKQRNKARRDMSFCPQFDYLPEYLTVHDTFNLFAGLRGLEQKSINKVLNDLTQIFKLDEFDDKLIQNLSGGNKRKVSSAISFIGRPSVVFLDEPTTGMDPAARRYLWTVIKRARDLGMTIVLTTHSMEECEALSTKLGIMVNGQFQCLGSVQQLKNKFGKGYTLIIKCKYHNESNFLIQRVQEFVSNKIKGSKLKDSQQETLFYQIESDENNEILSIAELFTLIESNKDLLKIETYSLSQTTLEQVFLSFAKEQKSEEEIKASIQKNMKTSNRSIRKLDSQEDIS
nr:ATP-binding cassette transporter Abca3-like2 [Brachionus angularis]